MLERLRHEDLDPRTAGQITFGGLEVGLDDITPLTGPQRNRNPWAEAIMECAQTGAL